jgi:hypothetical protein
VLPVHIDNLCAASPHASLLADMQHTSSSSSCYPIKP